MAIVFYTCPIHPDMTLYTSGTENLRQWNAVYQAEPADDNNGYCEKCDQSYFKHQCKPINFGGG